MFLHVETGVLHSKIINKTRRVKLKYVVKIFNYWETIRSCIWGKNKNTNINEICTKILSLFFSRSFTILISTGI